MFLTSFLKFFSEGLFPERCIFCKKEGGLLCVKHRPKRFASLNPTPWNGFFVDGVFVYTSYHQRNIPLLIERFKYNRQKKLGYLMGAMMSEIELEMDAIDEVFVPVPLHWTRFLWRGFNQSKILSMGLSKKYEIEISSGLKRIRATKQQARLSKAARLKNTQRAFVWKGDCLSGKTVYLVDDVCASGATLQAAARVLKNAGATCVYGVVFARSV